MRDGRQDRFMEAEVGVPPDPGNIPTQPEQGSNLTTYQKVMAKTLGNITTRDHTRELDERAVFGARRARVAAGLGIATALSVGMAFGNREGIPDAERIREGTSEFGRPATLSDTYVGVPEYTQPTVLEQHVATPLPGDVTIGD